ncbi:aspartate-semialdehyde dehydrogenase [Candidatus Nitrososphaera evergladensis SR1]|jgi:aspartate-semialdehyde dehydrogenase|uniref:aspartate-semialdehyde dehydrogenase n=1 Tax=Candidatus Nitrososphaera evergladensis SR1 TaxID=1459636 RepID=A0A075MWX0_9ARCH|nr:aspartate-semialdehyde dehydrogenase [Candidatus Nitrososphaera evergladensis]AIF85147.1 aspartate-semialdehyde dehydrogenase [Candidatus Nitrososphaera evergladensis SR1]
MLKVAVIGATGAVGQEFVVALNKHKWFQLTQVAASERSAGKKYVDALRDPNSGILKWHNREEVPEYVKNMTVSKVDDIKPENFDLIFTALESDDAKIIEPKFAKTTPVISTAAAFRYESDVPILIPGVNDDQADLLKAQGKNRGWKGFVAPLPNCTTTGLAITLKPVLDKFGINKVIMTSMQALSGAGRSPGVIALDITDNVIPYIPKEEEKVQVEAKKILGKFAKNAITPADFRVSCTCTRVPVLDGHTETVFVETAEAAEPEDVKKEMLKFSKGVSIGKLPSAPKEYIVVHDDPTRPQPRIDRELNDGMTTAVGRLRKDTAFDNGIKYVLLSHNEKMGSAKGAVLLAELLKDKQIL